MDVKATRKTLGLSQAALAEQLGVTQTTISRFEAGDLIPNARTLLALEALLARQSRKARGRAA